MAGKRINGKKVYHLGKHFKTYHVISYILITMVVYVFYYIYDYLFVQGMGVMNKTMLTAIFALIEMVLMVLLYKGGEWLKKNYYYELDNEGVHIVLGKKRSTYSFDKFESAEMGMFSFVDLCPMRYTYDGKKLTLSQFTEDMYGMNLLIVERISDHVEIPEGLVEQLNSFAKD